MSKIENELLAIALYESNARAGTARGDVWGPWDRLIPSSRAHWRRMAADLAADLRLPAPEAA